MNKKRISLLFVFILQFFIARQDLSAQNRITLSSPKDPVLSGATLTFFFTGNYFYERKPALNLEKINLLDASQVNRFDRSAINHYSPGAAKTSDILLGTSMILPAILMADKNMRKDGGAIAIVYLQSIALTAAEIQLVKGLVQRARPFTYNSNAPLSEKLKADAAASFFSGHTAMVATATSFTATVFSIYHPDSKALPYVYIGAAALPIATGYMRYRAGMHFPTDIAAGLIIGALNGFLVAKLHD